MTNYHFISRPKGRSHFTLSQRITIPIIITISQITILPYVSHVSSFIHLGLLNTLWQKPLLPRNTVHNSYVFLMRNSSFEDTNRAAEAADKRGNVHRDVHPVSGIPNHKSIYTHRETATERWERWGSGDIIAEGKKTESAGHRTEKREKDRKSEWEDREIREK